MHQSHWGLEESPFRGSLDPKFFYESPTHEEALARLHFLVENRRRMGLLLGQSGSGKSLLIEVFGREVRSQGSQACVASLLGVDTYELLWTLAVQLGLNPVADTPRFALWRDLKDRLVENRYQQVSTVLMFDDVDQASEEALQTVSRLLQVDPSPESRVTVVMAANQDSTNRLGRRLLDLAELRIELESWDAADTAGYLRSSIEKAGGNSALIDDAAAGRLHELSGGVPRRVSQLAELALLAGAGQQLSNVDEQTVESVYDELSGAAVA